MGIEEQLVESSDVARADLELASGLLSLALWASETEGRSQVELEEALFIIRSFRLGYVPASQAEQVQAAFSRTGDKILRMAITRKIRWHDEHFYDRDI